MNHIGIRHVIALTAAGLALGGSTLAQAPAGNAPVRPVPGAPPAASSPAGGGVGSSGQISAEDLRAKLTPLHARIALYRDAGKLAGDRGRTPAVKDVGKRMDRDFQRLDDGLSKLAKERGFDVGAVGASETAAKDAILARLRGESGDAFDTDFVREMSTGLEADVAATKQARDSTPGSDARVKKWLDDAVRGLQDHLNQVRAAKVAVDKARGQGKG
ncbi:DUF4142 domain-containing protein [Anaeromyxobacter oryzisoli]|uniref:DUF4142 domain-containing protein n=1 Tax=Anaeromyxobacter oryzisoli TaxID=2925408 RepID=UPI001F56C9C9|nr:DUF4142 domain-containing protein [Anaeromyxobacter sp. SG63]